MVNKFIYDFANILRKLGIDFQELSNSKVNQMKREIAKYGNKIEFKIEQHPDGSWTAESTNIDGIITGGKDTKNISHVIKDAIFTYYEIPPHLCLDSLLKSDNEPVEVTQRVYV